VIRSSWLGWLAWLTGHADVEEIMTDTLLNAREYSVLQVRRWAASGRLFALIDACDTPTVPEHAVALGPTRAVSLYKGRAEEELWAIAPYLFAVDGDSYEWITSALWSAPWGVLLLTDASLDDLRHHFRQFLTATTASGEEWYFRFYDPRVMRTYLESCTDDELTKFLGPVRAIGITNADTYGVTVLSPRSPSRVS
jgi:hypothetical protein